MVLLFSYFSRYIFCMSFRPRFYGGFFCAFARVRPRTRVCTRDNYIYRQNNYTIPVKKSTAILSRFLFFPQAELFFADSFRENIRKPTWKRRRQNLISVKPKDESYPQKYMIYANARVPMRNRRIKRKDFLHTFYVSQGDFYEQKYFVHLPLPLLP